MTMMIMVVAAYNKMFWEQGLIPDNIPDNWREW